MYFNLLPLPHAGRGNIPSPLTLNHQDSASPIMGSEVVEFIEPPQEFDTGTDPGARTALHLAIAHSNSQVVDILLNHKSKDIQNS